MNERIDKLLVKAGAYFGGDGVVYDTFDPKKFAELIVKECMDIARNVGNISEPYDLAPDRCYEIEQRIQDRFGVEE
jgi:hypothetical protein